MQERIANVSKFISIKKELNLINDNQRKFVCNLFKESYDILMDKSLDIETKEKVYKICKSLTELYSQLDKEMFCRVHKSFVINFLYIKSIKDNNVQLYHCDNLVPISRSYKKEVLAEYTNFLERDFKV